MAINYPQRYDDDFLNTIKTVIDHVNAHGKTIQDLVADGQLTEEQYANLITTINSLVKSGHIDKNDLTPEFKDEIEGFSSQLAHNVQEINKGKNNINELNDNKMDKNTTDISVSQINKNKGLIDETYLSDTLKQQITGDTPIHSIPADDSITTEKLVDQSVTHLKRTRLGEDAILVPGANLPNFILNENENSLEIPVDTVILNRKRRVRITQSIKIPLDSVNNLIYIDLYTGTFEVLNSTNDLTPLHEEHLYLSTVKVWDNKIISCDLPCDYEVNGRVASILSEGSVLTENIFDKSVTSDKRTVRGEPPILDMFEADLPNFDTTNKTLTLYAPFRIFYKRTRLEFNDDVTIPFHASDSQSVTKTQYILLNVDTQEFRMLSSTNEATVRESEVTLGHVTFENGDFSVVKYIQMPIECRVNGIVHSNAPINKEQINERVYSVKGLDEGEFFNDIQLAAKDLMNVGHRHIYSHMDHLVSEHPGLMEVSVAGVDDFGNEIKRYDIKPPKMYGSKGDVVEPGLPKIFWTAALHGRERTTGWVVYETLKILLENRGSNRTIENFLNNHHLIVLPVANPSGWDDRTRPNRNGVDLNRNQPNGWKESTPGTDTYSGTHPLSEKESIVINDILHEENLKISIDFHNFSIPAQNQHFTWVPTSSKRIRDVAHAFTQTISTQFKKDYPALPDGVYGYVDTSVNGGMVGEQGLSMGIYGTLFEISERFYLLGEEINTSEVITSGVKAFLNWNLLLAKNVN